MSATSAPAKEQTTTPPKPPAHLSGQDATDWLAIERTLGHLQTVLPSDPYVLTIPQEVEPRYHHTHPYPRSQWLHQTPFLAHEHESTQYSTWHLQEPNKEMYVQHLMRPREKATESIVGTPRAGGVKKTMSLGAYKKKVAGGTPGPDERKGAEVNGTKKDNTGEKKAEAERTVKKPAVKGPVERVKADEEVLAAVEDGEDIIVAAPTKKKEEVKKDLKRKREESKAVEESQQKRKREDSKISENREAMKSDSITAKEEKSKSEEGASRKAAGKIEVPSKKKSLSPAAPSELEVEGPAAKKPKVGPADDVRLVKKQLSDVDQPTQTDSSVSTKGAQEKSASPLPRPKDADTDVVLPPRLSPLREDKPTIERDNSFISLPSRLSPTLPANIEATLAARASFRSTSRTSEDEGKLSAPRSSSITKRKSPKNGFRANSSSPMVRSDVEDVRGRTKAAAPKVWTPSPPAEKPKDTSKNLSHAETKQDGEASKRKLIVKLQFNKSARETVRQLLRLPAAKPKNVERSSSTVATPVDARHREQRDTTAKGVAKRIGPANKGVAKKVEKAPSTAPATPSTPTTAVKRAREDDSTVEEPAPKRKKEATKLYEPPARRKKSIPEALDVKKAAPSTPTRPTSTPTVATQKASSQSPPAATPSVPASKKTNVDLLTAATATSALKRETSRESQAQVPTPSATSSSPAPNSQQPPTAAALKSTTTSAPAPATKTPRQKAWEAHRTTLETLGRELKHAAQPNRSSDSSATTRPSPSELRHARRTNALKSLESLLAYFLAFTCTDEAEREASRPLSTRPWRTLYNYFPFVREQTKPFPPLSGLASSLAVVFCAHIANGLAPRGPEAGAAVVEAWGFMAREGKDAEARLDVQKLMAAFPKAWAKASVDGSEEPLEPGKFEGSFKLPLGVQTAPVQAVRAAYAMMQEWIGKEGAEYDLKLRLDMA